MRHTSRRLIIMAGATGAALGLGLVPPGVASAQQRLTLTVLDGTSGSTQIATMNANGGTPQVVGNPPAGVWASCADWWPGRDRLLFTQQNRETMRPSTAASMTTSGTQRRTLVNSTGLTCISSDAGGSRFAFTGFADDRSVAGTMLADGSDRVVLFKSRSAMFFSPAVSPDGSRVAVNRVIYGPDGSGVSSADLFVVDLATGAKANVTKNRDKPFYEPSWAGNSRLLAVRSSSGIVTMGADGSGMSKITQGGDVATSPVLSPSGKRVAYLTCAGDCGDPELSGTGTVWRVKLDGSGKKELFSAEGALQPNTSVAWIGTPASDVG